jgi:putative spermidine/putrescine transport system substrate-binding protein
MEAKKAGVRVYPTNEAFAQALKNEEIGIGIMWKARVVQWQNAGISVQSAAPSEGLPMYVSGFCHPEERAQQGGRLRLHERDAGEERAGELSRSTWATTRPSPTRRWRPTCKQRIGFTPEEESRLSISTTATSPRTTPR